ncbi:hypothetical protein SLH46_07625 [Draconibacterium sp. IB214405]|uniref:hypothetical protein n=1 Tax=Draconibacterium sp. IB214405 TaxID=3097352 RepID=UPI002A1734C0|nr:hypothetical protein [Draconibacterium sp. IB214405]MDX8339048.1 hypothetical protein [Draconibacterium sp. IB214405]
MTTLTENVQDIKHDTESLIGDYLKLFSIKQSEKVALLLGVFVSIFVIAILFFMVIIFCSLALATIFNNLLVGEVAGYWIIGGSFFVTILIIGIRIIAFKKPIFANLFLKFIVAVFDIDLQHKTLKGAKAEILNVHGIIEMKKDKLKVDSQMFRYILMESFFREFFGLFKSKKKNESIDDNL